MGRSHLHRDLRASLKPEWEALNTACGICGQATIDWGGPANMPDSFEMDHIIPRVKAPELEYEPTNQQPSHHRCNRNKSSGPQMAGIGITSEAW